MRARIGETVRARHALALAVVALAMPALGQPSIVSSSEQIAGLGVQKDYALPADALVAALRCHLCKRGDIVVDERNGPRGLELGCPDISPDEDFFDRVAIGLSLAEEQTARPWARVVASQVGSPTPTRVVIGAVLEVDGERAKPKQIRRHFFKPSAWAQAVWKALDSKRRCP